MAIEAEIVGVENLGRQIVVNVVYRDGAKEDKQSITFFEHDASQESITARIVEVGQRLIKISSLEVLAKELVGQKIVVEPEVVVPVDPEPVVEL